MIVEIRIENLYFSEDPVESNSIPKEGFEGKICFESNACTCGHEGDEVVCLNALKVYSNLESFRWMHFDSKESSDIDA